MYFCIIFSLIIVQTISISSQLKEYKNMKSLWRETKIRIDDDYRFQYQRICFCDPCMISDMQVMVKNNRVKNISLVDEKDTDCNKKGFLDSLDRNSLTIDDLFKEIRNGFNLNYDEIKVKYHKTYGYPTSIYLNPNRGLGDDEISFHVKCLIFENDLSRKSLNACYPKSRHIIPVPTNQCPKYCRVWYDGCNRCSCDQNNPKKMFCTKRFCEKYDKPKCEVCKDKNMKYSECGTCDQSCFDSNVQCSKECKIKCQCNDRYPIYHNGKCIKERDCPSSDSD